LRHWEEAAQHGYARAQNRLALAYVNGDAGYRDFQQGIYWCTESAQVGDTEAQFNLAQIYANAPPRFNDFDCVKRWMEKSARAGHAPAQYALSRLYARGLILETSPVATKCLTMFNGVPQKSRTIFYAALRTPFLVRRYAYRRK
jgi:TPR repeat protein